MAKFLAETLPRYGNLFILSATGVFFGQSLIEDAKTQKLIEVQAELIKAKEKIAELSAEQSNKLNSSITPADSSVLAQAPKAGMDKFSNNVDKVAKSIELSTEDRSEILNAVERITVDNCREGAKIKGILNKYLDIINSPLGGGGSPKGGNTSAFMDIDIIGPPRTRVIEFLKSLDQDQIGAVFHISAAILILQCLFSIVATLFGNSQPEVDYKLF